MAKQAKPKTAQDILNEQNAERERVTAEAQRLMEARPTPTQEENDLSRLRMGTGEGVVEAEPSGEAEVVVAPTTTTRAATSDTGGASYRNRADKSA